MDLFEFNDDFIASVAGGMSDEDVLELFADSIRAGADVLEKHLNRTIGPEMTSQVQFVDGAFEIPLTQEQYDAEYGATGASPQANVRRAVIGATIPAAQEMAKVLSAD